MTFINVENYTETKIVVPEGELTLNNQSLSSSGVLSFELVNADNGPCTIKLTDLSGQVIHQKQETITSKLQSLSINTGLGLSTEIYIITVEQSGKKTLSKLINVN